jgi:hypothetical protein
MRAILKHEEHTRPSPTTGPVEDERTVEKKQKAITDGREELLGLSREFCALAATDAWLFSSIERVFDLKRAAVALAGLGNSLNEWRPQERAEYRAIYKKALRIR